MSGPIRVKVGVAAPAGCPLAGTSTTAGTPVRDVTRSVVPGPDGKLAVEFTVDADAVVDQPGVEPVFEMRNRTVYRFEHDPDALGVCGTVEQFGCPVSDVHAREDTLFVTFHAAGPDTLHAVVDELDRSFENVTVYQITSVGATPDRDVAVVDRNQLTDRQREVLDTAYEMGYFEYPKRANAGDVATALGVSRSTFAEHLAAAQGKVLESVVGP